LLVLTAIIFLKLDIKYSAPIIAFFGFLIGNETIEEAFLLISVMVYFLEATKKN
jgi:hypothetical protein